MSGLISAAVLFRLVFIFTDEALMSPTNELKVGDRVHLLHLLTAGRLCV